MTGTRNRPSSNAGKDTLLSCNHLARILHECRLLVTKMVDESIGALSIGSYRSVTVNACRAVASCAGTSRSILLHT